METLACTQLDFTSLFEKLEKVEVSKKSRITPSDEAFLIKIQKEKDQAQKQLESCRAILQAEAEKQKELNLSKIVENGEYRRNNDPYLRASQREHWQDAYMFDYNYPLLAIKKNLKSLNRFFFSKVIRHFNDTYHLTVSSSISEKLDQEKDLHFEKVLDYLFDELGGMDLTESGEKKIISDFRDKISGPYSYRGAEVKGKKVVIDSFFYVRQRYNGAYELDSREERNILASALSYFEQKCLEPLNHIIRSIPEGEFDIKEKHSFHCSDKIDNIKVFKNNRLDIEFVSSALAREFYKLFELKPAQERN